MAGSGSALDRNDFQLMQRVARALEENAEQLERLNDNLEGDDDGA